MVASSDNDSLPPLSCKVVTEEVEFLSVRGPRVTRPLAHLVCELCKITTHKAVGLLLGLHRGTVKAIDQAMMEKVQSERPLDGIDVLGFDEIAAGKGQSDWTLICAPEGPRGPGLLHIMEGRKEKDLTPFWSWFGKERSQKVTHAVMDMWPAFRKSFLAHCPKGKVISDKFHVIRHLLDAVNEGRKQELKRLGGAFRGAFVGKEIRAPGSEVEPQARGEKSHFGASSRQPPGSLRLMFSRSASTTFGTSRPGPGQ